MIQEAPDYLCITNMCGLCSRHHVNISSYLSLISGFLGKETNAICSMNLGVKAVTEEVFKNREQHSLSFSQSRLWILLVYDNSAVIFLRGNLIKKKK